VVELTHINCTKILVPVYDTGLHFVTVNDDDGADDMRSYYLPLHHPTQHTASTRNPRALTAHLTKLDSLRRLGRPVLLTAPRLSRRSARAQFPLATRAHAMDLCRRAIGFDFVCGISDAPCGPCGRGQIGSGTRRVSCGLDE
jgi:hypothetical protein